MKHKRHRQFFELPIGSQRDHAFSVVSTRWGDEYGPNFYERVDAGKNKMKTLVAIGRKLLSVFYAVLKIDQSYDAKRYLQRQSLPIAY